MRRIRALITERLMAVAPYQKEMERHMAELGSQLQGAAQGVLE